MRASSGDNRGFTQQVSSTVEQFPRISQACYPQSDTGTRIYPSTRGLFFLLQHQGQVKSMHRSV